MSEFLSSSLIELLLDNTLALTAVAGLAIAVLSLWNNLSKTSNIPTINSYPNDVFHGKANMAFVSTARGLIKDGIQRVFFSYVLWQA